MRSTLRFKSYIAYPYFLLVIVFCSLLHCINIQAQTLGGSRATGAVLPKEYQYLGLEEGLYSDFFLVEIAGSTKHQLRELGMVFCRRLGANSYIVRMPRLVNSKIKPITGIKVYGQVSSLWKIPKHLIELPANKVQTFLLATSNPQALHKLLTQEQGVSLTPLSGHQSVKVSCSLSQIKALLNNPLIEAVTQESLNPQVESRVIDMNLNPNTVNALKSHYPDLQGQGMLISIQEPRYDITDIDLLGKNIPSGLESSLTNSHSTDMATVIAGRGNSSYKGAGVAPMANISSSDFADVLPDPASDYQRLGIAIQNHSYGTEMESFYGVLAQAYDQSAIDNPSLLHVFSAGNQGLESPTDGIYQGVEGYANLTGNFKMSKNSLVVSAVDTIGNTIGFPSKGPAYDGRVKPEIVAYSSVGSSNAAALVSGTVGLLQQAYQEGFGMPAPAALIKALIINSARDAGEEGLDFRTGYGSLDALRTVRAIKNAQFIEGSVNSNETQSFSLNVPENARNLKITLVWADAPAAVNSAVALMNDLDLSVLTPTASLIEPWVLNASAEALGAAAVRGKDRLNNVEQVSLVQPEAGVYTLQVEGFDMIDASQSFYIAYHYDLASQFEFTFPTATDYMPFNGETTGYIRWNETLDAVKGSLEYRFLGEEEWRTITNDAFLSEGHFRWQAPDTTAKAQIRMKIGEEEYLSETFKIARPTRVSVGFNCGDSLLFRWPTQENSTDYQLYALQGDVMVPVALSQDTSIIVKPAVLNAQFFAIAPRGSNGDSWARTETINYELQENVCYISSFFAENAESEGVRLTLRLSDEYQVNSVIFERVGSNALLLGEVYSNNRQASFLDSNPQEGLNEYRAIVVLDDGTRIVSEVQEVFMLVESQYSIFPNPLPLGEPLRVFSKTLESQATVIRIYDNMGRLVWESDIISNRDFLDIPFHIPGLYIYQLEKDGEIVMRKKLLVNWY